MDVVGQAIYGPLQGEGSGKQDEHDKVGKQRGEPDDLKRDYCSGREY